jgi:hypothetical protein
MDESFRLRSSDLAFRYRLAFSYRLANQLRQLHALFRKRENPVTDALDIDGLGEVAQRRGTPHQVIDPVHIDPLFNVFARVTLPADLG